MTAVAIPVDPMADFQNKLKERVRNDIRDLLPDDAVAALVKKAVEEEFFKPRKIDEGYGRTKEEPSWFVTEIRKAAEPIIREAVGKVIAESPETVHKVIAEYLDTNKLSVVTAGMLTSLLADAIFNLNSTLQQQRR